MREARDERALLGRVGNRPAWIRSGSVLVRAAHLLAASAVAGGVLLGIDVRVPHGWWAMAGVSGVLLLGAECIRHRELYREPAGWATVVKLVLLAGIFVWPAAAPWWMSAAFVVAVLGAHAPRHIRHHKLL